MKSRQFSLIIVYLALQFVATMNVRDTAIFNHFSQQYSRSFNSEWSGFFCLCKMVLENRAML